MRAWLNHLIGVVSLVTLWGADARAEGESPQLDAALTDEELLQYAEEIPIFDERPDKPFDRDTEVRLTGEQLAARGATDLASALALLPDVTVRDAGRGGFNIDIRGARKGAVAILVDGVLVTDPYYGTFDVSTIPVTDIVQIRVSTTPKSPIDGPGGPGGVVEVLTRDAIGSQLVVARLIGDSLPTFGLSGSARVPLAARLALRVSATGTMGARDLELPMDATLGESRRAAGGAARLEYRDGDRRVVVDGFVDDRHYIPPPNDTTSSTILMIDRETTLRASTKADDKIGKLQLQGQAWAHSLDRRSRYFQDSELTRQVQTEELSATRFGAMALATRPVWKDFRWATSATVDHEQARVTRMGGDPSYGHVTSMALAVDGQYERKRFRIDAAAGVAVPIGLGADPWPEGKLVAKYKPLRHLELTATTGYKGRAPSLRERFDSATGNPELGPEQALHAELRAIEQIDRLRLELAPFYRRTTGTVRSSTDPADMGKLVNLDRVRIYGIDVQGKVKVHAAVEVGGAYGYVRARSYPDGGMPVDDPLDRLPHHRADGWVQVTVGRVSALARVKYVGESINQQMPVDGYALVEGNLTAKLSKEYLAVIKVDDALDVRPETRPGFHAPGRVVMAVFQGSWE